VMTTTFETHEAIRSATEPCVVLREVDWSGYESLLRIRDERSAPRMVYLDGSLFLVSPSFPHEHLKERLGWFVNLLVEELDVPCVASGSTTLRRKSKKGGVEGDQTYYLANEALIRGKAHIDLDVDPPPDLAVEVAWPHKADAAVEVYRRFKIPEVWVCDGRRLKVFVLDASEHYAVVERSRAFPIDSTDIDEWILKPREGSDTAWAKQVRRWVREIVAPRLGNANPAQPLD
jgi:Uma2 family endonuclease